MDTSVTPYSICTSIFIRVYCKYKASLSPRENGKICLFILDLIRQSEYSFKQLTDMIETKCDSIIVGQFRKQIADLETDFNMVFELFKQIRSIYTQDSNRQDHSSVSGVYLKKLAILFDRLTHQACSRLYDDLVAYVSSPSAWQTPRTTRSKGGERHKPTKIYQISHEIDRLQANEARALSPKDLYESLRRPNSSAKRDASFLRYLNLLRVNESVGSKYLLMAYFDMVSDSVPRSYSALNYAIWYLHHGEYKRAIECLKECYCCAQAADDDKCLLVALMWLARIVIQARLKKSIKYNVTALLELIRKRSHKANAAYVQAMTSMTLEQLYGPVDNSEILKKYSETLKQVALSSRQHNHLLTNANQPNPLDKEDTLPSAETLAVRNSMNDILAMHYAQLSAHYERDGDRQSAALASQTLLHFDLIEKCGNEDVFIANENTFIAIQNLAYHVWHTARDIQLVRELLVDLTANAIPSHRTDLHSIWRRAFAEMSFEYYLEQENWNEATRMIRELRKTDLDEAELRQAELYKEIENYEEALVCLQKLVPRIDFEERNLVDPVEGKVGSDFNENGVPKAPINCQTSIEHKAFIKAKALLLESIILGDEAKLADALHYSSANNFKSVYRSCLMALVKQFDTGSYELSDEIEDAFIDIFANGTKVQIEELRELIDKTNRID